ncbi:20408_t:CDS:2 [Funneliformis geosporum]|uniref:1001_t:CDS:1 n=1 Tax=Funneliformis geosporum TaxID=1117311 RepID=A0A9W4T4B6_9GLOM|nr:1001_t:CDS:2 [Funneliformis geosporum]CAI2192613.1 20408_t:CDS:2 [Funneliformis geosporum]
MPPRANREELIDGPKTFRKEDIINPSKVLGIKGISDQHPWYIIVDNKVYDIKDFVSDHPGGAVILTHIGKDSTDAFYNFHPEGTIEILANYYVGDISREDIITSTEGFTQELREYKELFKKSNYFESSKLYYAQKVIHNLIIWAISVTILVKFGDNLFGVILSAAIMGLFWQQCGWLSHDFLHHQVFKNRKYNDLMGDFLGGICLGFAPTWWKDKHNTHHAAPNVHGQDPDIDTHPLLTWSEHALFDLFNPEMAKANANDFPPWFTRFMVEYQTLNYFPILGLARISWCFQSIFFVLPDGQNGKPANARMPISLTEQLSIAMHYVWYFYIFSFISSWKLMVTFFFASQVICGILLALVFALNHNGMAILTEEEAREMDFFVEQVITGRDIIALNPKLQFVVDWFCGGLNYQIEHHLFPALPRHVFHKVQPIIQTLCEKHKIPYCKTTFYGGTKDVFNRLGQVSASSRKIA